MDTFIEFIVLISFAIAFAIVGNALLKKQGEGVRGGFLGFLLGPIGVAIAYSDKESYEKEQLSSYNAKRRECHVCGGMTLKRTSVCSNCGREIGTYGHAEPLTNDEVLHDFSKP